MEKNKLALHRVIAITLATKPSGQHLCPVNGKKHDHIGI